MATTNITGNGRHTQTFDILLCSPVWEVEFKQHSISFSAVNILLSITAILGNSLILVALHKESSLHPPSKLLYRCLATTDLLVGLVNQPLYAAYWMSVVYEHWSFCRYAKDAIFISSYVLCGVSLMTMTAISVDRLLAMLLGLRYKEIVTLRRTYIILAIFWFVSLFAGLFLLLNYTITILCTFIISLFCLVTSTASYTKIFRALSHHQAQIQDYAQQQPSQPNALNMARYRKAVYSALWVQLALVVCYVPRFTVEIMISLSTKRFSNLFILHGMANVLVFFNSTLNPFLYCWKISEVRRAVKQTIRQAICYAQGQTYFNVGMYCFFCSIFENYRYLERGEDLPFHDKKSNEKYEELLLNRYMSFAGWEVPMAKNCDRGLEIVARGRGPKAAFST